MNILVLNGSPKGERSNTLRLTNAFLDGIRQMQNEFPPEIEKLDIAQMEINPCRGCFSCWKSTPGKCCIYDDMETVLEKILKADLIIWSFPLYYFGLPGKLKTVMDRQLPLTLPFMESGAQGGSHPSRYDMSEKKTVLISTCGFYTAKSNYGGVTAQFDRICGKGNYTALFCGEGELFSVDELSDCTEEYLETVRRAGAEYVSVGIKEETFAKLNEPLFEREVFERMADASWGITQDGEKEDYSLTFTKQMAALYNPASYGKADIIFDMDYTDIGKRYRIILGKSESRVTEQLEGKPATVIHTPFSVWKSIAAGEIAGADALMKHMYSVEGDFDILLRWGDYFGHSQDTAEAKNKIKSKEKSDMRCLLTPWCVFWVAASINNFWGSIISVFVCCLLPVIFYKNKKTVYDVISAALIGTFSIMLIVDIPAVAAITLSYLAFGIMWSVSACFKIPLTAEYSMNDYGGENALSNSIFIKTNRILTAAWGILYLLIPIWTYFIMLNPAASYIGIINSVIPAIMGVFTYWFQRWYPRKIARGA